VWQPTFCDDPANLSNVAMPSISVDKDVLTATYTVHAQISLIQKVTVDVRSIDAQL